MHSCECYSNKYIHGFLFFFSHYIERDELKRHYNVGQYWIEVEIEDLASFDEDLANYIYKQPVEHLQLVPICSMGEICGRLQLDYGMMPCRDSDCGSI